MHTTYVDTHPGYISWHYSVDDIEIYQEMPDEEIAYHAGTKPGNDQSIGIEICETGNYAKAEENAIALTTYLMRKHNIPIAKVVPHQFWSGKYCPHIILRKGWGKFKDRIALRFAVEQIAARVPGGLDISLWSGTNTALKQRWIDTLLIKIGGIL